MSVKIRFLCEVDGREAEVSAEPGETLVQAAYRAKVVIQQTCGGSPSCTDCKVIVKEGIELGLEPALGPELRLMGNVYFITKERLACQSIIKNDVCVWVPTPRPPREKSLRKRS
jgi:ferredoxin